MSRTHITSDIHFSHANIIKFCPESRPFRDADEMDRTIIHNWNADVHPLDTTIIIGDVAFCNVEKAVHLMNRLNGKKILVKGNHDFKLAKDEKFRNCFESVHDYLDMTFEQTKLVLFHYPIYEWDKMHHGSVHFHGHVHARPIPVNGRIYDVAMDGNQCRVYNLPELIRYVKRQEIRSHGDGDKNVKDRKKGQ